MATDVPTLFWDRPPQLLPGLHISAQAPTMENFAPQLQRELREKYAHLMLQWYEIVDWTEPLIVGLLLLHVTLFAVVFLTRHYLYLQFALFMATVMLLFVTESLNTWARANWQLVATQQYFDTRGVFIGIFYAAPLLALGFFQLVRIPTRRIERSLRRSNRIFYSLCVAAQYEDHGGHDHHHQTPRVQATPSAAEEEGASRVVILLLLVVVQNNSNTSTGPVARCCCCISFD
jgi:transmembrane protein 18